MDYADISKETMGHIKTSKNIALVIKTSSGIGTALSLELVNQGLARSLDKMMMLKDQMGAFFIPIVCDVASKIEIDRACH